MTSRKLISFGMLIALAGGICLPQISFSQDITEVKTTPFYIDLNTARKERVYDVQLDAVGLQYTDAYGKWNDVLLSIYNWKQQRVAGVMLEKTFGLNYFNLRLNELYADWELNTIYVCELIDESGRKYILPIRPVKAPEKKNPIVEIVVNPISFDCEELSGKLVEFYGKIQDGKAPYKTNWYVLNSSRTEFLYQPKEEQIAKAGLTPVIQVNKNPDYYVLFVVHDACGGMQQKMVHLTCGANDKKINTIFVEPINYYNNSQLIK